MLPDFAVLGSPRCGTSWLMTVLANHSQIEMPMSELPYLEDPEYYNNGVQTLNRYFSDNTSKIRGFKRAGYIFHHFAGSRLKLHYPKIKIVIILRDPVKRVLSSYFHHMRFGYIPMLPPNQGIPYLISGAFTKDYPRSVELLSQGNYGDAISRLLEHVEPSNIHLIDQSRIKNKSDKILKGLFSFLEVDYEEIPLRHETHNAGVYSVPTLYLERFHNRIYYNHSKDKMRLYPPTPGGFKNWFCRQLRIFNYRILQKIVSPIKPQLDTHSEKIIRKYYSSDLDKLYKICSDYNWTIPNWCKE